MTVCIFCGGRPGGCSYCRPGLRAQMDGECAREALAGLPFPCQEARFAVRFQGVLEGLKKYLNVAQHIAAREVLKAVVAMIDNAYRSALYRQP